MAGKQGQVAKIAKKLYRSGQKATWKSALKEAGKVMRSKKVSKKVSSKKVSSKKSKVKKCKWRPGKPGRPPQWAVDAGIINISPYRCKRR